jgi:hypothetical protein
MLNKKITNFNPKYAISVVMVVKVYLKKIKYILGYEFALIPPEQNNK